MNSVLSPESLIKMIRVVRNKVKLLVPQGSYDEFSKEELIMIATGLDEISALVDQINEKVAVLQTKMNDAESSLINLNSQLSEKSDIDHVHNDMVADINTTKVNLQNLTKEVNSVSNTLDATNSTVASNTDNIDIIRGTLDTKSDTSHNHDTVYSKLSHTHDDRYYTESEMNTKLDTKANTSHTHTKSQITDFPAIPSVGNGTVTIEQNGVAKGSFTMNQSSDITVELTDNNTTYTAASATPKAPGTAAVGTSSKYAREDHVHPVQTTVSGNAGSATKLATARKIGNASFNGTADITLAGMGAAAASHTHTLANNSSDGFLSSRLYNTFRTVPNVQIKTYPKITANMAQAVFENVNMGDVYSDDEIILIYSAYSALSPKFPYGGECVSIPIMKHPGTSVTDEDLAFSISGTTINGTLIKLSIIVTTGNKLNVTLNAQQQYAGVSDAAAVILRSKLALTQ